MARRTKIVTSNEELVALEATVIASATRAVDELRRLLEVAQPLEAFTKLKFDPCGFHPAEARALNLIEQINQTFTYLASVRATQWLLSHHAESAPFELNLGNEQGTDVRSLDGSVAAETFASVDPRNNRKLAKDVEKVGRTQARYKYVFYLSPSHQKPPVLRAASRFDVNVVPLPLTFSASGESMNLDR